MIGRAGSAACTSLVAASSSSATAKSWPYLEANRVLRVRRPVYFCASSASGAERNQRHDAVPGVELPRARPRHELDGADPSRCAGHRGCGDLSRQNRDQCRRSVRLVRVRERQHVPAAGPVTGSTTGVRGVREVRAVRSRRLTDVENQVSKLQRVGEPEKSSSRMAKAHMGATRNTAVVAGSRNVNS